MPQVKNSGSEPPVSSPELKDRDFHVRLQTLVGAEKPYAWAARIGLSKGAFTRMWTGGVVPGPEILRHIKEKTGASIDWLLTGDSPSAPSGGPGLPLDAELLQNCVQAIEELLNERDLELAPEKKGRLVVVFYEYSLSLGRVDRKAARDMIGLAA